MNSENNTQVRQLTADKLEAVLNGTLSAAELIEKWPCGCSDKLVEQAYCLLYHFRDDEDIRSKDPRYAECQRDQFRAIIRKLRLTNN